MPTRSFKPGRRAKAPASTSTSKVEAIIREAKQASLARSVDYRARSLALSGWICARCAREFERENLHLLTVHHKDGNHENNPPNGSNWENLCVYCHEAEHTRGLLGDFLKSK